MKRLSPALLSILVLATILFAPELLANKFETMGGGVSGMSWEKVRLLKMIGLGFGGFVFLSGLMILIFRHSVTKGIHVNYWREGVPYHIPVIIMVLGALMALPYFF